jgi:hypothetical protein
MVKPLRRVFFVHNFFDRENITFALLKAIPHVKNWWDTFCEKKETERSTLFVVAPIWGSFRDVIKEQYYHFGSYDDLYTRWTTHAAGKIPNNARVHQCIPYIVHQDGYQRL